MSKTIGGLTIPSEEPEDNSKFELTEEQKLELLRYYKANYNNPPTLKTFIEHIFPDMGFDGRDEPGRAVKAYLATIGLKPKTNVHKVVGEYKLSPAEEEFIQNNAGSGMKIMEIAKVIFNDAGLSPLSNKVKAIRKFIQDNDIVDLLVEADQVIDSQYEPPKSYLPCMKLVNRYTHDTVDTLNASERDKQGINALVKFLHTPRFLQMINTYSDRNNRELFLSEFVRACHNKPDLTSDEVNLYLNLCSDIVLAAGIQKQIETLSNKLNTIAEDPDGKISLPLAQAITAKTNEYDKCLTRQKQLIGELNGNRAKRLEKQQSGYQNLSSLVAFWQEKKSRDKMIKLAKLKEEALSKAVKGLEDMDSIKAEMWGSVE